MRRVKESIQESVVRIEVGRNAAGELRIPHCVRNDVEKECFTDTEAGGRRMEEDRITDPEAGFEANR